MWELGQRCNWILQVSLLSSCNEIITVEVDLNLSTAPKTDRRVLRTTVGNQSDLINSHTVHDAGQGTSPVAARSILNA